MQNGEIQTDHDLLIAMKSEFGTKLDRVINDVKDLNNNLVSRVDTLERTQVGRDKCDAMHKGVIDKFKEYDDRIDALEKWRAYVLGIGAIVGGLITFFGNRIFEAITR